MIYAVSDLHGCYDRYRKLLDKLNLGEQDTLYVLGDALDRGPEGFRILSDMASRPQVVGLLGNHEAMALDALPGLLGSLENGCSSMSRSNACASAFFICEAPFLTLPPQAPPFPAQSSAHGSLY